MPEQSELGMLQQSIMQRAASLAEEYMQRARRSREHFIEDENERLHLREERETLTAKIQSERLYRREVQSSELDIQKKLDQLRWELIKQVMDDVRHYIEQQWSDKQTYMQYLQKAIQSSADQLSSDNIHICCSTADHTWLHSEQQTLFDTYHGSKTLILSSQCHPQSSGIMLYNEQQTERIDQTLDGRMQRLKLPLQQLIAESLFSELTHEGEKLHGR